MREEIEQRMKVLKPMILDELAHTRKYIYCGNDDYDISACSFNPKDYTDYTREITERFIPGLILTCTDCGKKRMKFMIQGPTSAPYID